MKSFNGAATFQSQRLAQITTHSISPCQLQWGRDLSVAETSLWSLTMLRKLRLQWGRDLSVAETRPPLSCCAPASSLQWGRDLSVAETRPPLSCCAPVVVAFNGAATFQSQRHLNGTPLTTCHSNAETSMNGRDLSVAETG